MNNIIKDIRNRFSLLTVSQELIVKELLSNQLFAKHFNSFELMWLDNTHLTITRIADNLQMVIFIGSTKCESYFVNWTKLKVIDFDEEVSISNILNHFLINLE